MTALSILHDRLKLSAIKGEFTLTADLLGTAFQSIATQYGITTIDCKDPKVNPVENEQFSVTAGSVTINTGSGTIPGLGQFSSLIFTESGGDIQLVLAYSLPSGWTPGSSFTAFSGDFISTVPMTFTTISLSTQPVENLINDTFPAGFTFAGNLSLATGAFQQLQNLYANPVSDIAVAGAYTVSGTSQTVNLTSTFLSEVTGQITLTNPYLAIVETAGATGGVWFNGTLSPGGGIAALNGFAVYPSTPGPLTLNFQYPSGTTLGGLSDLAGLVGSADLQQALPSTLANLGNNLALTEATLTLDLSNAPFSVTAATVTVNATNSFSLYPSLSALTVNEIPLYWTIDTPFGASPQAEFSSYFSATIGGGYQADISIDSSSVQVYSENGTLDANTILADFNIPVSNVPAVTLQSFHFAASINVTFYSVAFTSTGSWAITSNSGHQFEVPITSFNMISENGIFGTAQGSFTVGSSVFTLTGSLSQDVWSFSGALQGELLSLDQLISEIETTFGVPSTDFPQLSNITVTGLSMSFTSEPVNFQFNLETTIDVLTDQLDLGLTIAVNDGDSGYTASLTGNLTLAGESFIVTFSDTGFTASWSDESNPLSLNTILSDIGLSAFQVPAVVSDSILSLTSVSFSYDTEGQQVSMSLITSDGFTADFGTNLTDNTQYYLAIYLADPTDLKTICDELSIFVAINFSELLVAIANFKDETFTIPNTSYTGIIDGIEVRANLTMSSSDNTGGLGQAINYLSATFNDQTIIAGINLTENNIQLLADIENLQNCYLPSSNYQVVTVNDVDFSIQVNPIEFKMNVIGTLNYDFQSTPPVQDIPFTGLISFEIGDDAVTISSDISEATTISQPYGVEWLTIQSLGLGLSGQVSETLQANFTFTGDIQIAAQNAPNPIPVIFGATISLMDDIVNVPYFKLDVDEAVTATQIWDACFPPPVTAPGILSNIVINELHFYLCEEKETLPGGHEIKPGLSFLTWMTLWDINLFAKLKISESQFAGKLELPPLAITVDGTTIVSIGGGGLGSKKYNIGKGGAEIEFNTSNVAFAATVDATVLGITTDVNASFDSNALTLSIDSSSFGGSDSVSVNVTNLSDPADLNMSFSCSINLGINCSVTMPGGIGTLNIDDNISGTLSVSWANSIFSASLTGAQITVQGQVINFPPIDLSANLTDLTQLASVIEGELTNALNVSTYFADLLNLETYIANYFSGLYSDVGYIVNVLYNYFNFNTLETLFPEIYQIMTSNNNKHIDGQMAVHLDYSAPVIGNQPFHADTGDDLGNILKISTTIDLPSFTPHIINFATSSHLDLTTPNIPIKAGVPVDTPEIKIPLAFPFEGDLGFSAFFGVSMEMSLESFPPTLTPHVDGVFKAGLHEDVFGVGDHQDTHQHFDQSGI